LNKIVKCNNYYTFDNIKELKEKVDINRYIKDNDYFEPEDNYWADAIEKDFKTICSFFGLTNVETCWDVSYSQGNGASFTGRWYLGNVDFVGLKEYVPTDKTLIIIMDSLLDILSRYKIDCDANIIEGKVTKCKFTGYCHSNTMCFSGIDSDENTINERYSNILIYYVFSELSDWLFNQLRNEYEYITSKKYIMQYIVDNEIEISEEYLKDINESKNTSKSK